MEINTGKSYVDNEMMNYSVIPSEIFKQQERGKGHDFTGQLHIL